MILKASPRFLRDLKKIKSIEILDEVDFIIHQTDSINTPDDIAGFKRFKTFPGYGRIRISNYRIGIEFSKEIIVLKCILDRAVIYKNFP